MSLVSIIIPVHPKHNRNDILGICLRSINRQNYPKDKMELIIVGDGYDVTSSLLIEEIKTTVYNFKNYVGIITARNKGIELSKGEFLVFLDADCITDENWLRCLLNGFKNDSIGGCGGRINNPENICSNRGAIYASEISLPFVCLGNAIFRRNIFDEVGTFDEHFVMRLEDVDFSWRVCLKGYRIEYVEEAIVFHRGTSDIKECFSAGIGTRILINKYRKIFNLPSPLDLRKYAIPSKILKNLTILSGYAYAVFKEKLHRLPVLERAELTDKFLQPASIVKPLTIKRGSDTLNKPNYVIWWKSEDSYKIVDLRKQKQYVVEDISAKIWEYIMDRKSENDIIEKLLDEYEVKEEDLKKDVEDFVGYLCEEKLLSNIGKA